MAKQTPCEKVALWVAEFDNVDQAAMVARVSRATLYNLLTEAHLPTGDTMARLHAVGAVKWEAWLPTFLGLIEDGKN